MIQWILFLQLVCKIIFRNNINRALLTNPPSSMKTKINSLINQCLESGNTHIHIPQDLINKFHIVIWQSMQRYQFSISHQLQSFQIIQYKIFVFSLHSLSTATQLPQDLINEFHLVIWQSMQKKQFSYFLIGSIFQECMYYICMRLFMFVLHVHV